MSKTFDDKIFWLPDYDNNVSKYLSQPFLTYKPKDIEFFPHTVTVLNDYKYVTKFNISLANSFFNFNVPNFCVYDYTKNLLHLSFDSDYESELISNMSYKFISENLFLDYVIENIPQHICDLIDEYIKEKSLKNLDVKLKKLFSIVHHFNLKL